MPWTTGVAPRRQTSTVRSRAPPPTRRVVAADGRNPAQARRESEAVDDVVTAAEVAAGAPVEPVSALTGTPSPGHGTPGPWSGSRWAGCAGARGPPAAAVGAGLRRPARDAV